RALREDGGFDPKGKRAVLLGAGGAARAAAFALAGAGAGSIAIVNRTPERAQALASALATVQPRVEAFPWDQVGRALEGCHLLVNCTSLGMKHSPAEGESPLPAVLIPREALVYDIVYNPLNTPFLVEAQKAGARTLGGLGMLVYQGAASFQLWTGREAPVDIMFQAARKALSTES
ncbi:MAG: shikimate dehydrogenase, partial [Chloroflexota bacterium]|nr:shikimate dehydrogenase [Chloroflexota bacterium]